MRTSTFVAFSICSLLLAMSLAPVLQTYAQQSPASSKNAITSQERVDFLKIQGASEVLADEASRVQARLEFAEELAGKSRSKDNAAILHDARIEAALVKRLQDKITAAYQALANRAVVSRGYKLGEASFDPSVGVVPVEKH